MILLFSDILEGNALSLPRCGSTFVTDGAEPLFPVRWRIRGNCEGIPHRAEVTEHFPPDRSMLRIPNIQQHRSTNDLYISDGGQRSRYKQDESVIAAKWIELCSPDYGKIH